MRLGKKRPVAFATVHEVFFHEQLCQKVNIEVYEDEWRLTKSTTSKKYNILFAVKKGFKIPGKHQDHREEFRRSFLEGEETAAG